MKIRIIVSDYILVMQSKSLFGAADLNLRKCITIYLYIYMLRALIYIIV